MAPVLPTQDRMLAALIAWHKRLEDVPGWKDFRIQRLANILHEFEDLPGATPLSDFSFGDEVNAQHRAITSYYDLSSAYYSLDEVQYYFRRYPFASLPVSRYSHLQTCCELYFGRFYQLRERIKRCLNDTNKTLSGDVIEIGPFLKAFDKTFDVELRARNGVHHHAAFTDASIDGLTILTLVAGSKGVGEGWDSMANAGYRRISRQWAARATKACDRAAPFVEAVATAMLERCPWLVDTSASEPSGSDPKR